MEASAELAATDDRLRIGGNQPPLGELLSEETRPFRERATALIENVNQSRIDSPETAAQVTQLGGMLADLKATVEEARKARAKPFDEGKAAVQSAFKRDIIDTIDTAMNVCRKMLQNQPAALLEAINPLITRAIRAGTEIPGVRVETREATRLGR
jgi:hypothetical protein